MSSADDVRDLDIFAALCGLLPAPIYNHKGTAWKPTKSETVDSFIKQVAVSSCTNNAIVTIINGKNKSNVSLSRVNIIENKLLLLCYRVPIIFLGLSAFLHGFPCWIKTCRAILKNIVNYCV